MGEAIYQHFRPDERAFIDQATDWIDRVLATYSLVTTGFLNPRQVFILRTLINGQNATAIQLFASSALAETEYVKVILAPSYYQLEENDFELACLRIDFASKFVTLKHSQILGTFLGETGLERSKIGDIVVYDTYALVLVGSKLATLFVERIHKIARSGVKLKTVPMDQFKKSSETFVTKIITVSSLRLDKVIASVYHISRNLAQNLIQSKQVKVNYTETLRNDFELAVGDLISVRGYGRIKVEALLGMTKKDKLRVEVQLISSRQ